MHSAIAVLAVGLVLACVGSLVWVVRQQKLRQSVVVETHDDAPATRL